MFGKIACFGWVVEYFIVEDRVVEGKTKADWVGGLEVTVSNITGSLVSRVGTIRSALVLVTGGVLGDVSVIIALHLVEEDLTKI